ncbi:MAG: alkaline phosphatase family protein [Candidatus Micrarchaeota archaeon]|nr:alkaline phosphatase family protein [Candidatus Micrarchaeota archaeon]
MMLTEVESMIRKERGHGDFVYPFYDGYSIANVAHTVSSLLGIKPSSMPINAGLYKGLVDLDDVEKVIAITIDGFGYRVLQAVHKEKGFFNAISDKGIAAPITSVCPSNTSAGLASISTGMPPQQHGIVEGTIYFKGLGAKPGREGKGPGINFFSVPSEETGHYKDAFYSGSTIYEELAGEGVASYSVLSSEIADSSYLCLIKKGSRLKPFRDLSEGASIAGKLLDSEKGMAYINLYIDTFDRSAHKYGPYSSESIAELKKISQTLQRELIKRIAPDVAKKTIVMVTSDHGQSNVDKDKITYLKRDEKLESAFKVIDGYKIYPSNTPHGMLLHLKEGYADEICTYLSSILGNTAMVITSNDALRKGLFGKGKPGNNFTQRIGDVLVFPHDNRAVWYLKDDKSRLAQRGTHGGLNPDDMLSSFAIARIADLR